MATYATDLQTVTLADSATGWSELSGHQSGGSPAATIETYIHNGTAVDQGTGQATGTNAGMEFDYGANISWTTGHVFLAWQFFAAPTNIETWANGGMRFGVGSSSGNMRFWNAVGNDFGAYPYGGWQNTAVDPQVTGDATDGSPVTGNYRIFGSLPNMLNKITKGSPHVVDAIRYGRGEIRATGTACTFAGMAAANDADTARWGLFQVSGGGYLWKGLMSLGLTATSVTFSDSNKAIRLDDTPRVSSGFNKIEINNDGSSVTWTSISISGVQTSITGSAPVSPGDFEVVADGTVTLDGCTFTDLGSFTLLSKTEADGCTWRRCRTITPNGATVTGCLITNSEVSPAMVTTTTAMANITGNTFVSAGTGYAINLGTVASTTSFSWDNTDTGYAAQGGTATNRTLLVNVSSGQTLTINVASGATTPTYNNTGAGNVVVVAGAVTVSVKTSTVTGADVGSVRVFLAAANGTGPFPYQASVTISNSGTTATVTHTGHSMATGDKVVIYGASHQQNNGVHVITVTGVNSYTYTLSSAPGSNPTGTITATFVVLEGLTDANGDLSTSRVYSSSQPVQGWARKSTTQPFYKTAPLVGTVNSGSGYSATAVMILDQ